MVTTHRCDACWCDCGLSIRPRRHPETCPKPGVSAVKYFTPRKWTSDPPSLRPATRRVRRRGRPLHQHEPRSLQVPHKPLGRDPGHRVVRVANALPAFVAEREGQGFGDLVSRGGAEVGFVGHGRTIRDAIEHNKNFNAARRQRVSRGDTDAGGAAGRSRRGQKLHLIGMGFPPGLTCAWEQ
jgi:hypothetical protein